jgi:hypothetical protein
MSPDQVSTEPTKVDPGLRYAFHRLCDDETALVAHLSQLRDQHRTDHEIHFVTRDLLAWSHDNLARIIDSATKHRIPVQIAPGHETLPEPGQRAGTALDREQPGGGLSLLEDLRTTYLLAAAASLSWELLAQYAQARRATDLLDLVGHCHPRTLRQLRWANTMLKTQAPQALTSL